jgi:hypothetical protein
MAATLAVIVLTAPVAFAADPPYYVKQDTWHETILASREALTKAEATPGGVVRFPDFGATDFTISVWIRTTAPVGPILGKCPAYGVWSPRNKTFFVRDGEPSFAFGNLGVAAMAGVAVNDGQWHHVAVAGRDPLDFYVDGAHVKTDRIAGTEDLLPDDPEDDLSVGWCTFAFPAENKGFEGDMDELRVYNRRLTGDEIKAVMADPKVAQDGLAGWWPFDDGAADASGNLNHGELVNVVPSDGKVGGGMYFNSQGGVGLPNAPGGISRSMIAELVARDFATEEDAGEIAWETEDLIWEADWRPGDFKDLAGRYAEACKDLVGYPRKAAALMDGVDSPAGLAEVRAIYLLAHRNHKRLLRMQDKCTLMVDELDYLQELHSADDQRWNTYRAAVEEFAGECTPVLAGIVAGDEAAMDKLTLIEEKQADVHGNLPHRLPFGPPGPGRFGAVYAKLKYTLGWDRVWRVGKDADVVVQFEDGPYKFVFWRGCSYIPAWASAYEGPWFTNEFFERRGWLGGGDSMMEPMSDKQCRYSHVRVIENHDARVVVHWRYTPTDLNYNLAYPDPETGRGDWCDEYFTIYPDGIAMREATIMSSSPLEDWIEYQESIFINQPGTVPNDSVPWEAVTLANLEGETQTYKWEHKFPAAFDQPKDPAIQLVNFRTRYKPFSVVTTQDLVVTAYPKDARFPESDYFNTWDAWPVSQDWSDARRATDFRRVSHSNLTHIRWKPYVEESQKRTWLMLTGMTDKPANELAPIARSWLRPPELEVTGAGYTSQGYDPSERAYVITSKGTVAQMPVRATLAASKESPVVNLALIVKGWGDAGASLILNGEPVAAGRGFRVGHIPGFKVRDLVVWIEVESTEPLEIVLTPAAL